jgi:hypothetical protein
MNSEVHSTTGVSPAQLLFGNAINLNKGIWLPQDEIVVTTKMSTYIAKMLAKQQYLIDLASQNQERRDNQFISKKRRVADTPTEYPIGTYVLVTYPEGPPTKFHSVRKGPLRVLDFVGRTYKLFNLATNKEEQVDISRISPFHFDAISIDPDGVANKDYQLYVVDSILEHIGDPKHYSQMEFKVRWKGYDDTFNRWLPWRELIHNSILHKYLFENGLKRLIPKKHRKDNYD